MHYFISAIKTNVLSHTKITIIDSITNVYMFSFIPKGKHEYYNLSDVVLWPWTNSNAFTNATKHNLHFTQSDSIFKFICLVKKYLHTKHTTSKNASFVSGIVPSKEQYNNVSISSCKDKLTERCLILLYEVLFSQSNF